jgi:hypothetical protein
MLKTLLHCVRTPRAVAPTHNALFCDSHRISCIAAHTLFFLDAVSYLCLDRGIVASKLCPNAAVGASPPAARVVLGTAREEGLLAIDIYIESFLY